MPDTVTAIARHAAARDPSLARFLCDGAWRGGPAGDEGHRRLHGQPERRAARDIEGQVGAGVHPGQADDRDGDQDEGPAAPAEPGEGRRSEGGGDSGVAGQIAQAGGRPAAAADARQ